MFDLPHLVPTAELAALTPFNDARRLIPGESIQPRPAGQELDLLREAVADFRKAVIASGMPDGVTTFDLVTLPYPTRFGLWRSSLVAAPMLFFTNRMIVVQWVDDDGHRRTLLWEPSDHERGQFTPYFERLSRRNPLPDHLLATRHGTVLDHLATIGLDPADVDYLVFDHLHTQDVRRLIGTTRPAADLGSPDGPMTAWFPNARLIVQAREWAAIRHLHPLQVPWYQPDTYRDLPADRLLVVDGDVQVGPGVALLFTPGHTAGNMSLVLHTATGLWTSSENGVAAEAWAPHASSIPGVSRWAREYGQDVIMNANTLEFAAWQYNSMVVEALVADPTPDGRFPQCFPSSELVKHRFAPGLRPTYSHGRIEHGRIRANSSVM